MFYKDAVSAGYAIPLVARAGRLAAPIGAPPTARRAARDPNPNQPMEHHVP